MDWYGRYTTVRDAAWRTLIDLGVQELPLRPSALIKQMGIVLNDYPHATDLISKYDLHELAEKCAGLTICHDNTWIILYNPNAFRPRIRLTLAHELGHVVLGHSTPDAPVLSRVNIGEYDDAPQESIETDATQYGVRVLAPSCVLYGLGLHAWQEIQAVTGLSRQAAEYRARRMAVLRERGAWGLDPLERVLYAQLLPWIKFHNPSAPDFLR